MWVNRSVTIELVVEKGVSFALLEGSALRERDEGIFLNIQKQ